VNELLDALVRARVKLAIATNKPHAATVRLAGKHLTRWSFCAANGHVAGDPLKPDPAVVHRILSSQQLEPSQAVFIGDSETDIETARNAGIDCISVLWGLRTKEELKAAGATRLAFTPADVIPLIV
jgi:phosphoglycolate phosphatase